MTQWVLPVYATTPSRVGGNPEKKVYIQQIFEIKSSIYLALCWIPAYAGMTLVSTQQGLARSRRRRGNSEKVIKMLIYSIFTGLLRQLLCNFLVMTGWYLRNNALRE
ncbi:hypothetical protein [Rickettsia asembonensis]|uniref:hypothetical protein n=1 Tax=Rickettsia asembonensis TaxID=1068590 RepID=UPI0019D6E5C6|nr:hypothetical protein [Rickettsia asembonensis]